MTDYSIQSPLLLPLLDYLATFTSPAAISGVMPASGSPLTGEGQGGGRSPVSWREWQIEPIGGGRNNLLYHVTSEHGDFAVKFTMRDDRDRAGGEYSAMLTLWKAGLDIAPRPVFLDQTRYPQPVVVQTWLEGDIIGVPPTSEADWRALIEHYVTVHTITPGRTDVPLSAATLTMDSAATGCARIAKQLAPIPAAEQSAELRGLIASVEQMAFPVWPPPPVTLCRCDPNPQNFLRRPVGWASVDWEYSGWGDPAFELADLMAHPAYLEVPSSRLNALVEAYNPSENDSSFATRVQTYYRLMLVWWSARFARMLYEVSQGRDQHLAPRSPGWKSETQATFAAYLRLAAEELA